MGLPGCANCKNLEKATRQAIADLGLGATIEKVTDYPTIAGYGVMSTPALVIDEDVVVAGRVPTSAQIRQLLTFAAASSEPTDVIHLTQATHRENRPSEYP